MPRPQVKNFAIVTVSLGYSASATSVVLTTGHGALLPGTTPYWLLWWNSTDYADPANDPNKEFVYVTARAGDTLTVTRGQDGTSGTVKNLAGKTYKMQLVDNAALFEDLYGKIQVLCGRFIYVSATACRLDPYNGNRILINGSIETIPSAGVTVTNSGLVSDTLYYAYVFMSSGTMTLEFSTTAPAVDTTYGHPIKTGDGTRTLVGMAFATGSTQFIDTDAARLVVSRFNQPARQGTVSFVTPTFTFTGTPGEIDSTKRIAWLQFAGAVSVQASGRCSNNTGGQVTLLSVRVDGTTGATGPQCGGNSASANYEVGVNAAHCQQLAMGYHYATITGVVSANTGTVHGVVISALLPGQA